MMIFLGRTLYPYAQEHSLRFWWLDIDGSALPKRICATLPIAGEYRIGMVEQFKWGHAEQPLPVVEDFF